MSQKIAHNAVDLSKETFGSLSPKYRNGINKSRKALWYCECKCGGNKTVSSEDLKRGKVKSCGCLHGSKPSESYYNFSGYKEMSGHSFYRIKHSAEKRGLEFSITKEYIYELYLLQNRKCALTGLNIEISALKDKIQTASLDRIDSSKGYIEGNVQWLHVEVNQIKWDLPQERFIELCRLVVEQDNVATQCVSSTN